ncbi:MAG: SAP domain-containing protein [Gammaproteobacteria bacterium]|jgi:hypothetical protein
MRLQDIQIIVTEMGLKPGRSRKADLIRLIQRNEGNFDCYGSAQQGECTQGECLWRQDCLSPVRR